MSPGRKPDPLGQFDRLIERLRQNRLRHRQVVRDVRRRFFQLLDEALAIATDFIKEYGLFLLHVLLQCFWYIVVFGAFVFVLTAGVELCVIGYSTQNGLLRWPAFGIGLMIVGIGGWFLWELIKAELPRRDEAAEEHKQAAINEERSLPWGFVCFDAAVLAVLYLLTLWPPYWCRILPLSFAQSAVYSITAGVAWQKIPDALKAAQGAFENPKQDQSVVIIFIVCFLFISILVVLMVALLHGHLRRMAAKPNPRAGKK